MTIGSTLGQINTASDMTAVRRYGGFVGVTHLLQDGLRSVRGWDERGWTVEKVLPPACSQNECNFLTRSSVFKLHVADGGQLRRLQFRGVVRRKFWKWGLQGRVNMYLCKGFRGWGRDREFCFSVSCCHDVCLATCGLWRYRL